MCYHLCIDFDPRNAYVDIIDESIRDVASLVEIMERSPDFDGLKGSSDIHILKYLACSSFAESPGYSFGIH